VKKTLKNDIHSLGKQLIYVFKNSEKKKRNEDNVVIKTKIIFPPTKEINNQMKK
jgi:hypothetical protein